MTTSSICALICLAAILILIFYLTAVKYDRGKKRVEEHIKKGDILPDPASQSVHALRDYTVSYQEDGVLGKFHAKALDRFDAKFKAITHLNIKMESIFSVI